MKLRYCPPFKRVKYGEAEKVQQKYVREMLDAKAGKIPEPTAALFAFEMDPVYTGGRRQRNTFGADQVAHFRDNGRAEFVETLRGGHVTFHGPGQVVMYPVVDLKRLGLKVRDYICSLEGGIIDVLRLYGVEAKRTTNTGVWLDETHKIASLGVHVRRSVTSHGIAVNVATDPYWFDRIVACNLPDARVVSMNDLVSQRSTVRAVGLELADIYARRFGLELDPVHSPTDISKVFADTETARYLENIYS